MKDCLFFKKLCFQQPPWSWRNNLCFSTVIVRPTSGLIETVTSGFSNSNIREKTGQKLFLTGKLAFFPKKFCFQQPLRSWRNDLITPIVIVRLVLDPQKPSPEVCQARIYEKKTSQNFFFTWKIAFFFQKVVFSTTSLVLKKQSLFFHSNCQTNFWTNRNRHLRFFKLEYTRKNWPKTFPHWKTCLFFKKILFSTTSQVLKKWSYNFHSNC